MESGHAAGFIASADFRVPLRKLAIFAVVSLILLVAVGSTLDLTQRVFAFTARYEFLDLDEIIGAVLVLPVLASAFLLIHNWRHREAIADNQRLANTIVDSIPDAVTISDADGNLVYMNPAARKLTPLGPDQDPTCLHLFDLYAEALREKAVPEALAHAAEDGVWSGDMSRVTGDGREFSTADVLIAHEDSTGAVQYISSISRDLSNREDLEHRLQQKQKLEAIGQLAGGIAHQYNNMLMVIAGHTRRAMKLTQSVPEAQAPLEDVLRTGDIAAEMTHNLLLFTRRQPLERCPVRVSRTLSDVQKLLTPLLDERFALEVKIDDPDVRAETDAGELVQAIMNLALNARDAMPSGGKIEIRLRSIVFDMARKLGSADELAAGEYVWLSVTDTGTGIDEFTLEQLFEPFFTTKEAGRGTGLGLAMVLGFSQSSGGSVDVASKPGVGSTFHLYLPTTDQEPLVDVNQVGGEIVGGEETILLVEDNGELRQIVADMLDELGYQVLAAADGFDAVELEQSHDGDIDLLLTDVIMPDLSGPQVHRIISEARSDIETLFMSGYPGGQADGNVESIPEGATLLQKPIDPSALARAIRKKLEPKTGAKEVAQ